LKKESDEKLSKKNELEKLKEETELKLIRANKLTDLLADEGVRWKESVIKMKE
jgi:hypothetical protein